MSEETPPQQSSNLQLETDIPHMVDRVTYSRLYIISGIIIVLIIASCAIVYWTYRTSKSVVQSSNNDQVTNNSLNEGEKISLENSVPSVSNLPIGNSVGFYYGRQKQIQSPTGRTASMSDIIAYTDDPIHGVATTTFANVPNSITSINIGKGGDDSIVSLSSSYGNDDVWPDLIAILGGTSTSNGVFTKLSKKDPKQFIAQNPFLLPGVYHQAVYQARSSTGYGLYLYDFPQSKGVLLHAIEYDPENLFAEYRPIYFDEKSKNLLIGLEGGGLYNFKIYNFTSKSLTDVNVFDPRGGKIFPCFGKGCQYYSLIGLTKSGKIIIHSSSDSNESHLFAVDVSRWFTQDDVGESIDSSFAYTLPYCDLAGQSPIFSPDTNLLYCHSFKILDDLKQENLLKLDKLSVKHTETIININSATSSIFREYTAESPSLQMEEYFNGMTDEEIKEELPYIGLGLYGVSASSGDNVIAWLTDNRFLTVDFEHGINESNERITSLYINDLKGNKVLIDSGPWKYTYLGDLLQ